MLVNWLGGRPSGHPASCSLCMAKALMILWCNFNFVDVMNVFMFYLVIISDATNEFLPGDNKDLLK